METRVGVMRGGNVNRDLSLSEGLIVLRSLPDEYKPVDIYVDEDMFPHISGFPIDIPDIANHVDVVWDTLYSHELNRALETHGVSLISRYFPVARSYVRNFRNDIPLRFANGYLVSGNDDINETILRARRELSGTLTIRLPEAHEQWGVTIRHGEIEESLLRHFENNTNLWLEEHTIGEPVSIIVVENLRGEKFYTTIPTNGLGSRPINISPQKKDEAINLARLLHQKMGARSYSESTFILHPSGRFYFSSFNSRPSLGLSSPFINGLKTVGVKIQDFLRHIIERSK